MRLLKTLFKIRTARKYKTMNKYSSLRNPHSAIDRRGFTLIEIIILIVLAGILIPLILIPFVTGVIGSGKPEKVTTAMYLAHQRMEELMKYDYSRAELNTHDLDSPGTTITIGGANYQLQVEIYYVDNNFSVVGDGKLAANDRGYKRIQVLVTDPDSTTYNVYSVVTNFP
jgi:prepilin-type N-terminal cleavage/methylation domain-containing protein